MSTLRDLERQLAKIRATIDERRRGACALAEELALVELPADMDLDQVTGLTSARPHTELLPIHERLVKLVDDATSRRLLDDHMTLSEGRKYQIAQGLVERSRRRIQALRFNKRAYQVQGRTHDAIRHDGHDALRSQLLTAQGQLALLQKSPEGVLASLQKILEARIDAERQHHRGARTEKQRSTHAAKVTEQEALLRRVAQDPRSVTSDLTARVSAEIEVWKKLLENAEEAQGAVWIRAPREEQWQALQEELNTRRKRIEELLAALAAIEALLREGEKRELAIEQQMAKEDDRLKAESARRVQLLRAEVKARKEWTDGLRAHWARLPKSYLTARNELGEIWYFVESIRERVQRIARKLEEPEDKPGAYDWRRALLVQRTRRLVLEGVSEEGVEADDAEELRQSEEAAEKRRQAEVAASEPGNETEARSPPPKVPVADMLNDVTRRWLEEEHAEQAKRYVRAFSQASFPVDLVEKLIAYLGSEAFVAEVYEREDALGPDYAERCIGFLEDLMNGVDLELVKSLPAHVALIRRQLLDHHVLRATADYYDWLSGLLADDSNLILWEGRGAVRLSTRKDTVERVVFDSPYTRLHGGRIEQAIATGELLAWGVDPVRKARLLYQLVAHFVTTSNHEALATLRDHDVALHRFVLDEAASKEKRFLDPEVRAQVRLLWMKTMEMLIASKLPAKPPLPAIHEAWDQFVTRMARTTEEDPVEPGWFSWGLEALVSWLLPSSMAGGESGHFQDFVDIGKRLIPLVWRTSSRFSSEARKQIAQKAAGTSSPRKPDAALPAVEPNVDCVLAWVGGFLVIVNGWATLTKARALLDDWEGLGTVERSVAVADIFTDGLPTIAAVEDIVHHTGMRSGLLAKGLSDPARKLLQRLGLVGAVIACGVASVDLVYKHRTGQTEATEMVTFKLIGEVVQTLGAVIGYALGPAGLVSSMLVLAVGTVFYVRGMLIEGWNAPRIEAQQRLLEWYSGLGRFELEYHDRRYRVRLTWFQERATLHLTCHEWDPGGNDLIGFEGGTASGKGIEIQVENYQWVADEATMKRLTSRMWEHTGWAEAELLPHRWEVDGHIEPFLAVSPTLDFDTTWWSNVWGCSLRLEGNDPVISLAYPMDSLTPPASLKGRWD